MYTVSQRLIDIKIIKYGLLTIQYIENINSQVTGNSILEAYIMYFN